MKKRSNHPGAATTIKTKPFVLALLCAERGLAAGERGGEEQAERGTAGEALRGAGPRAGSVARKRAWVARGEAEGEPGCTAAAHAPPGAGEGGEGSAAVPSSELRRAAAPPPARAWTAASAAPGEPTRDIETKRDGRAAFPAVGSRSGEGRGEGGMGPAPRPRTSLAKPPPPPPPAYEAGRLSPTQRPRPPSPPSGEPISRGGPRPPSSALGKLSGPPATEAPHERTAHTPSGGGAASSSQHIANPLPSLGWP
jgi:hypothetical protein